MALFKFAVILVLACSSVLAEPVFRKRNSMSVLLTSTTKTDVYFGKNELVKSSTLNITVETDGAPGPPPRGADAAQIYQLVNEQVAYMESMPHNVNDQTPQSYVGLPLKGALNASISIQFGKPQQQENFNIKLSKVDYAKKLNATLTNPALA